MKRGLIVVLATAWLGMLAPPAAADHSWGSYHWARTANPFVLQLDNNLTTQAWRSIGTAVSADWSRSSILDTPLGGPQSDNKNCRPSSGRVEVCNGRYGYNGWLGLAQVWTSGGHIVQAVAKMNDSYLASSGYSATNRQHVLCQEVGHTFGLDHPDESGADLDTCMDYSTKLDNTSPNAHDYEQLETIYRHLDSSSTLGGGGTKGKGNGNRGGLRKVKESLFVEELGDGRRRFVWVHWKDRGRPHGAPQVD